METLYSTIYYSKYFIELNIDKSTQYVSLWSLSTEIDRVIKGFYCMRCMSVCVLIGNFSTIFTQSIFRSCLCSDNQRQNLIWPTSPSANEEQRETGRFQFSKQINRYHPLDVHDWKHVKMTRYVMPRSLYPALANRLCTLNYRKLTLTLREVAHIYVRHQQAYWWREHVLFPVNMFAIIPCHFLWTGWLHSTIAVKIPWYLAEL